MELPVTNVLVTHSYFGYVLDQDRPHTGEAARIDRVEREDEQIVDVVQIGTKSRPYRYGRYSSRQEPAVHHFHRLLAARLEPAAT